MSILNRFLLVVSSFTVLSPLSTPVFALRTEPSPALDVLGYDHNPALGAKAPQDDINASYVALDNPLTPRAPSSVGHSSVAPLPPVVSNEGKVLPSFGNQVDVYAKMADLSYTLVKGRVEASTESLEALTEAGWTIRGFDGISGGSRFNKETNTFEGQNHDLAGFVAFNPATGEAVVTFHGSQDANDWADNFNSHKVVADELGFNFHGQVHSGFAARYLSAKQGIYDLLSEIYTSLDAAGQAKFHLTTTGHSLGGGMATLAYADLTTDFAQHLWGKAYENSALNRVRALPISAPRVMDDNAKRYLEINAGAHNVVHHSNAQDPVHKVGPGKTMTRWLETSGRYGLTRAVLAFANKVKPGLFSITVPEAVAQTHGGYAHFGEQALQSHERTVELGGAAAQTNYGALAARHYGGATGSFEPKLVEGGVEALEKNIAETKAAKTASTTPASAPANSWLQKAKTGFGKIVSGFKRLFTR